MTRQSMVRRIERLENILAERKKRLYRTDCLRVLKVATSFAEWIIENDARATYPAFAKDFGYVPLEGEYVEEFYKRVVRVLEASGDEDVSP